jgi:phospholipid/cholesterol/gamma-HCH transport system substrate-binding protein
MTLRSALRRFALFVVASLALTWWIAGEITGRGPSGTVDLTARFGDVSGLVAGDDVRLGGLPVGRVKAVEVVGGEAEVDFTVDDDVDVPADSTIAVRWRNLIGQRYLALRPGTAREPLGDGDQVDRAEDVVDLGRIVNQLSPLAQAVGPDQVNRIMESLVVAFEGNEGAFDDLATDLASLAGALDERTTLLGQMQQDYAAIGDAIASRDRQIADMVTNLASVSESLDATDGLVARALHEFARFAEGTEELLIRAEQDLGAVLQQLPALTGTVRADIGSIEEALRGLPGMMEAVLPALNRGPYLRVNLLCLSVGPGACPHPLLFFEDEAG